IGQHELMYGTDKSKTLLSLNNKLGSSRFRIDIGVGSKTTRFLSKIDVFQNKSLKNKIDKNCLRGSVTGGKG
ncbi:MAG: hypothetical protein IKI37_09290, partial [Oscillospiraceae bacterium]|nr:hypothetical protein [Oscillospiraceae bacterium]